MSETSSAQGDSSRGQLHLITALPGAGKTTAIKALASALPRGRFAGFYTEEIRVAGDRKGFRAITFSGAEATLAHVSFKRGPRVGKYGVDVEAFEKIAVPEIDPDLSGCSLFVVDEIGKMECASAYFARCITQILLTGRHLVATVALKGQGLIADVKRAPNASVYNLDRGNRDRLPFDIAQHIKDLLET